jgi:hypothetical protein
MFRKNCRLFPFFLLILVGGCAAKPNKIAADPAFARNLLNALYAGKIELVRDSFSPMMQKSLPDFVGAGLAEVLLEQYGGVKEITFITSTPDPIPLSGMKTEWQVSAIRTDFAMQLHFDEKGKVDGIWFRSVGREVWNTATELGVNYLKQQKRNQP